MSGGEVAPSAVVIGAGPYGLSITAHLKGRGVAPRVFGDTMSSWRDQMPVGMFLKSTPRASSISAPAAGATLADYCSASGEPPLFGHHPVPVDTFIRYGCWFQERLAPEVEPVHVAHVGSRPAGFIVTLASGEEIETRAVVVATGAGAYAYVPEELSALAPEGPSPQAAVSHPSQHPDLSVFAGRRVAVIGAGQSALETAALLHEGGADVRLLVRESQVIFPGPPSDLDHQTGTLLKPDSPLGGGWSLFACANAAGLFRQLPLQTRLYLVGTILGPSGGWWLRERVERVVPIDLGCQVASASLDGSGGAVLNLTGTGGERSLTVDHVIACTGYRVNLDNYELLAPELRAKIARAGNFPRLRATYESSVPGLFFTGLASAGTFGPLMRFVCGTGFAARRISAALAR